MGKRAREGALAREELLLAGLWLVSAASLRLRRGKPVSPHPGTHPSAQRLLPRDANGRIEGGFAISASKRMAEAGC